MKKFFRKDGGYESTVDGWFLECKRYLSLVLLRFSPGSREAYHSHAFHCVSLILGPGYLEEHFIDGRVRIHRPGDLLLTTRQDFHKVYSRGTTYVVSLRGPWTDTWQEQVDGKVITLTHGRRSQDAP